MESEFVKWLSGELERREVSASQAALKGGISAGQLNHVLSGTRKPGMRTCRAIAVAFGLSLSTVLEKAGLDPHPCKSTDTAVDDQIEWDDVDNELISIMFQISRAAKLYLLISARLMFAVEQAGISLSTIQAGISLSTIFKILSKVL